MNSSTRTILYVTHDLLAGSLAIKLKEEGNNVIVFEEDGLKTLQGLVEKQPMDKLGKYVKKLDKEKDLIIFEDCEWGDTPVKLRADGFNVIGGSKNTDRMESNRKLGGKVAEIIGMKVPKIHKIKSLKEGIQFIKDNPARYAQKQEGKIDGIKGLNYIAKLDDGKDLIDQMEWLQNHFPEGLKQDFILQDFVPGREVAMGAYWNGKEFMKDKDGDEVCEFNLEHKALVNDDKGKATGETFTLIQFQKAKYCKLFQETLEKLRPALLTMDYRGCVDINSLIDDKGEVNFLEFTNRFGSPATSGHLPLMKGKWGNFLYAMSRGEQINFEFNPDWLIVALLVTSPYPSGNDVKIKNIIEQKYEKTPPKNDEERKELLEARLTDSEDLIVQFKEKLTDEEMKMVNLDYVYKEGENLRVSNSIGYALTVNGIGKTPQEAGDNAEKLLKKFVLAGGFWRNDWTCHYDKYKSDLTKWGYLEPTAVDKKAIEDKKKEEDNKVKETKRKQIREKLKQKVYAKENK